MALITDPYKNLIPRQFNPNYRNLNTYKEMITKDSMIVYAYDFVRRGVTSRVGAYVNKNETIQTFVRDNVYPAFKKGLKSILSAIYWGASVSELMKKPVGSNVVLEKVYTICPDLWWGSDTWEEDEYHNIKKVRLIDQQVDILDENGIQQLAIYTYRPEYSDHYGLATATQAYPYWYVKSRLLPMYSIYLEKHGSPSMSIKSDGNDDERLQKQYRNLGTDLLMILNQEDEIDILESAHQAGQEFKDGIDLMDKYILLSFLIPRLAVDEGVYSTRAQSQTHLDVYLKAETDLVQEITEWGVANIIIPMIQLNFGPQEEYGTFLVKDADPLSVEQWSTIIKDAKDAGVFDNTSETHLAWASELLGGIPIPEPGATTE